ncbi:MULTISPECIES: pseudouridine synthase [unclassified Sinorhizobium]|uniref:pseudouridine synthase n=1 Tax=unclassified Sinorhizobium TaxID=2613772 RepID=UPI0024C249EC|nr:MULTISPECIES: pseudouridine synthase [unclassified Sinorhizobium]MDK1377560.1 pseudouridine synthase [Sinorhizobium sp. 6-70]MDK1480124.1 pseudouridine synthase [Sinorhizobium sp. 6-117]
MKQGRPSPKRHGGETKAEAGKRVTLARALSKLGYCSRTQAEKLITDGRVSVGGRTTTDLSRWVDIDADRIAVDGVTVAAEAKTYLMLNKPRGLVTTREDPEGRPTVYSCLGAADARFLSPVGRLDKASEGLLLFTNDTVLAQRLLDPETHLGKIYHVQVSGVFGDDAVAGMIEGVTEGGERLVATSVQRLRSGDRNSWIEVELQEGRNRQIRRMLDVLGFECLRLVRVSIGEIKLGDLAKGSVRALTEAEIRYLRRRTGLET